MKPAPRSNSYWAPLLLAASFLLPAYAVEPVPPLKGTYRIKHKINNRYVDAWNDARHDYGLVTRDEQDNASQEWVLTPLGDNVYTIQHKLNGRYVDAWVDQRHDFALVTRDKRQTDRSQDWILTLVGDNAYTIQHKINQRYVDAWADKRHDFGLVTRDKRQTDGSQEWIFTKVDCMLPGRRLDYVYVKPSGGDITLTPTKAHVIRDWKYFDPAPDCNNLETDLSDHYPVRVTFSLHGLPPSCARSALTVLTYNTHLWEGDKAAISQDIRNQVLVYQDAVRRIHIADRVRESGADIVGLQEVWDSDSMRYFAKTLADIYPHSYFAAKDKWIRWTSGLVVLSKLPLNAPALTIFPNVHLWSQAGDGILSRTPAKGTDKFSTKGVVSADVELCRAPASPSVLKGTYTIQQKASGRYIDAWTDDRHDFRVVTREERQSDGSQDWVLTPLGDKAYTIQQKSKDRFVDAWTDQSHDYGLVTRDKRQSDASQDWVLTHLRDNVYTIQQKINGRYLDAWVDERHDFGLVTREERQTDGSQEWILTRVETIRLGVSHGLTDGRAASKDKLFDIRTIKNATIRRDSAAIIMGDFNVPNTFAEYSAMNDLFQSAGAVDAFVVVHGSDLQNSETLVPCRNTLSPVFDLPSSAQLHRMFGGTTRYFDDVSKGKICLLPSRWAP